MFYQAKLVRMRLDLASSESHLETRVDCRKAQSQYQRHHWGNGSSCSRWVVRNDCYSCLYNTDAVDYYCSTRTFAPLVGAQQATPRHQSSFVVASLDIDLLV